MSDDKMRAEFEKWAKRHDLSIATVHFGETWSYVDPRTAWAFEGYAAGQKAEREAIFIEWENGEQLAAEVERLRAELAEAKAELENIVTSKIKANSWEDSE